MDIDTFLNRYQQIGTKTRELSECGPFMFEPDGQGKARVTRQNAHMLVACTHMAVLNLVGEFFELDADTMGALRLDGLARIPSVEQLFGEA